MHDQKKFQRKQLGVFVYTQLWEFFGTFGMTVLLVLYMTKTLNFSDDKAYTIFGGYMALMYGMPIVGGIIIDHFLDKRTTVILGALLMASGSFLIMIPTPLFLYIALSLSIIGYGLFNPALIALVGQLYRKQKGIVSGFTLYYVGENVGAFAAPILCSLIGAHFGWNYGFGMAGLGMLTGIFVFSRGYQPAGFDQSHTRVSAQYSLKSLLWILLGCVLAIPIFYGILSLDLSGITMICAAIVIAFFAYRVYRNADAIGKSHVIAILIMLFFMALFYTLLSQNGTSFPLFFDRIIDRHVLSYEIPAPMLLSFEPLFMFLWAPLLLRFMSKLDFARSVINKYIIGLFMTGVAVSVFYIAAKQAQTTEMASIFYVMLAFFIFPIGELFIMPVGFAIVTRLAPKKNIGVMIGVWTFGLAMARFMAAKIAMIASVPKHYLDPFQADIVAKYYTNVFMVIVVMAVFAALVLFCLRPLLQRLMQSHDREAV